MPEGRLCLREGRRILIQGRRRGRKRSLLVPERLLRWRKGRCIYLRRNHVRKGHFFSCQKGRLLAEGALFQLRGRHYRRKGAFFVAEGRLCWREGRRISLEGRSRGREGTHMTPLVQKLDKG